MNVFKLIAYKYNFGFNAGISAPIVEDARQYENISKKLIASLEFIELDDELPFLKTKMAATRSKSSDEKAQIKADRKLALKLMNKSLDEDPTSSCLRKVLTQSLDSAGDNASNEPMDTRKKLRKRKLEDKKEKNEKKVKKSLSKPGFQFLMPDFSLKSLGRFKLSNFPSAPVWKLFPGKNC